MKKPLSVSVVLVLAIVLLSACSSAPRVTRVDTDARIDLSGRWNDTDARIVSNSLIFDCLNSPSVAQFIQQFYAQNGRRPAALVGRFRNDSSEHIDTAIISRAMEMAIVNSGMLYFVAGGDTREEIRNERHDQLLFASDETAAALANETGAILLLTGSINSIVDRAGNRTLRSYFVSAELTNIETNMRLWMGENSEIRKEIVQPRRRI
ncbi:MAG: penicillin-binding protein activator LpoB [Treponema sp.]|nr:penicillin-binding protein activator LpoB [Treponema sp.]